MKESATTTTTTERRYVLRSQIRPDPDQPRKEFNNLDSLAESLKGGILETLKVRAENGHFVLIDGERRWRAAAIAGIERLPIEVVDAKDVGKMQLTFGTQRENLTALEEAAAAARLLAERQKANPKFSVEALGQELGKSRAAAYELLALNKISKPVREALLAGKLDASKARLFATVPEGQHAGLLKAALEQDWQGNPMSVRKLRELIEEDYARNLNDAQFDVKDAALAKSAGACCHCPKRSGNIEGMGGSPNTCTDVKCYELKQSVHATKELAAAKAKGLRVISATQFKQQRYELKGEEEKPYEDRKGRTWGALAKLANVVPAVGVKDDGEVVKLFTRDDQAKIRRVCKFGARPTESKPNATELKRRAELEVKRAKLNQARIAMCLAAANQSDKPTLFFWQNLARTAICSAEYQLDHSVWKGRGLDPAGGVEALRTYVTNQVATGNLVSLIVDCLTSGLNDYQEDGGELAAVMRIWGVDWQKAEEPQDSGEKDAKVKPGKKK